MAAVSIAVGLWLLRSDPGLLEERLRPMIQRDQKPWDKGLMVVLLLLWSSWLVLTGLDAGRYHWSTVPLELEGYAAYANHVRYRLVPRLW